MLEVYLHRDSKFRSDAVRKGMSCHQLLFPDVVISEARGLVMLSALSPLTSSRPSVRDKCLGCRTQRNSTATGYSLLGTETRVRTLKNEIPVDKYFVDCGLDKICMPLVSSFRFVGAWVLLPTLAALALRARMLTQSLWQGWPSSLWNAVTAPLVH